MQQHPTKITAEYYEAAIKRIEELLSLETDDPPDSDSNLTELHKVSNIVKD